MAERDDELPAGKTCRDCAHSRRCVSFGFTDSLENTWCDFIPIRFAQRPDGGKEQEP